MITRGAYPSVHFVQEWYIYNLGEKPRTSTLFRARNILMIDTINQVFYVMKHQHGPAYGETKPIPISLLGDFMKYPTGELRTDNVEVTTWRT